MKDLTEPAPSDAGQEFGEKAAKPVWAPASLPRSTLWGVVLLWLLLGLTRGPLISPYLYSFDTVNLALALDDFDPTRNQPQPPGYPLFVAEERTLYPLLGSPERTFLVIQLAVCGLALWLLFLLGREMISEAAGWIAAALFLVNPIVWFTSLTSPLRPHLALFSILVALYCWRSLAGDRRAFYVASLALGVGGGFRPELCLTLLPLWVWTGWRAGGIRALAKGSLVLAVVIWIWLANLALACGGFTAMLQTFRDYSSSQTFQSAAFGAGSSAGWRHMAGRVVVWSTLGVLPWVWALPFAWLRRRKWPRWREGSLFMAIWIAPSMLFYAAIHSADPDHILPMIPMICLVGGFSLEQMGKAQSEARGVISPMIALSIWAGLTVLLLTLLPKPFQPGPVIAAFAVAIFALVFATRIDWFGVQGVLVSVALLGNALIFMGKSPFPEGPSGGSFRGLASLGDAYLGGIYETSYRRVEWVSEMTKIANQTLPKLESTAPGPVTFIWSRDGEPVWRKLAYYFPDAKIFVLDESGDPAVPNSEAGLWTGNRLLARYSGEGPIQLPVPKGGRLIWFAGGGRFDELSRVIPLHKMIPFAYSDLSADAPNFRWGSFEFVPQ